MKADKPAPTEHAAIKSAFAIRKRSHKKLWAVGVLFLMIIVTATAIGLMVIKKPAVSPKVVPQAVRKAPIAPNVLRFAAMGDMLAHDTVAQNAKSTSGYDFGKYFADIRPLYKEAEVVFCNQEGVVAGSALGLSGYPSFNAPKEFASGLAKGAGCNMINLANNHINDRGQTGIDASIDTWQQLQPLAIAGANKTAEDQMKPSYFTKNGIKVGFIAFADFSNNKDLTAHGLNFYKNEQLLTAVATEAVKNADIVIASMHWGDEDSEVVSTDQTETAKKLASLGVDVIIGTGPHVLQRSEWIKNGDHSTLVWYSIGNMLNTQLGIDGLTSGIAGFVAKKNGDKVTITEPSFTPTYMSYSWSAADRTAEKLDTRSDLRLQPLSAADASIKAMFPNGSTPERLQYVKQTVGDQVTYR